MFIILSKLKYPFFLQECLSLNGGQQQYENTNESKKGLKLTKIFSIPSFGKVKIKLSNISDPVFKNLSTKLRIVLFSGSPCDIEMLLKLLLSKFDWFGFSIKPKNFPSLTYTVANHFEVLKWVIFCAIWVTRMITLCAVCSEVWQMHSTVCNYMYTLIYAYLNGIYQGWGEIATMNGIVYQPPWTFRPSCYARRLPINTCLVSK